MKHYQIFNGQEKWPIVKRAENSSNKECGLAKSAIPKSAYYDWKKNDCKTKKRTPRVIWNKTPEDIEKKIRECRLFKREILICKHYFSEKNNVYLNF